MGFKDKQGKGRKRISIARSTILVSAGCSSQPPHDTETALPIKTLIVAAGEERHLRNFPGMLESPKCLLVLALRFHWVTGVNGKGDGEGEFNNNRLTPLFH
jgi:hypothetical protein